MLLKSTARVGSEAREGGPMMVSKSARHDGLPSLHLQLIENVEQTHPMRRQ